MDLVKWHQRVQVPFGSRGNGDQLYPGNGQGLIGSIALLPALIFMTAVKTKLCMGHVFDGFIGEGVPVEA